MDLSYLSAEVLTWTDCPTDGFSPPNGFRFPFLHVISLLFSLLLWACCCWHLCSTTVMFLWWSPRTALAIFPPVLYIGHGHRWRTVALVSFDSKNHPFIYRQCAAASIGSMVHLIGHLASIFREFCFQGESVCKPSTSNACTSSNQFNYKVQNVSSRDLWCNCSIIHVTKRHNSPLTGGKLILPVSLTFTFYRLWIFNPLNRSHLRTKHENTLNYGFVIIELVGVTVISGCQDVYFSIQR